MQPNQGGRGKPLLSNARTQIHRETAFEIADAPTSVFAQLRAIAGVIEERIDGKVRFFIPTGEGRGRPVLEKILEKFPVIRSETGGPATGTIRPLPGRPRNRQFDVEHGPAYNAAAPLVQQAAESSATVEKEPGSPPSLCVNRQGLALLARFAHLPIGDDAQYPVYGFTAPAESARALRRALRRSLFDKTLAPARERIRNLLAQLDRAGGKDGPLVVINPAGELADEDLDRLLAEERAHFRQLAINGTFSNLLDAARLFTAPEAARARAALLATRYPGADDEFLTAEIGVRLMERRLTGDLALSEDEVTALAALYSDLLGEQNGNRANAVIDEIRRTFGLAPGANDGGAHQVGTRPGGKPGPAPGSGRRIATGSAIRGALEPLAETRDELRRAFNPAGRGDAAGRSALALREQAARAARDYQRAEHAMADAHSRCERPSM
jgi:hypothetical protein